MKRMAMFAIVFTAAYVAASDAPATAAPSQVQQGLPTVALPDPIDTELWNLKASDADKLDALWPDSAQTAQILFREGPDLGGDAAYLAFVVYDSAVQHVYWVVKGSAQGNDLKATWNSAFAQRTNKYTATQPFNHWGGGSGGGGTGKQPSPHPTVFPISGEWQVQAITAAAALDAASKTFMEYAE